MNTFSKTSYLVCLAVFVTATPSLAALTSGFEDLPLGFSRMVPDPTFPTEEVLVDTQPFQFGNGMFTNNGVLTAMNRATAAPEFPPALASGRILNLNNINAEFDIPSMGDLRTAQINYIDYGGNVNLIINDLLLNDDTISDIVMGLFGGPSGIIVTADGPVELSANSAPVPPGMPVANAGTVRARAVASGKLNRFGIGGQEFFIDNFAAVPELATAALVALVGLSAVLARPRRGARRHMPGSWRMSAK